MKNNKKMLGIPVLIFVIFSMVCCLLCCCMVLFVDPGSIIKNIALFVQSPPYSEAWKVREGTKVFLENIKDNKPEIAYGSLTDEYKKIITSPEELSRLLHYPIKSYDLPYSRINDENSNMCTVIGTIIDGNDIGYAVMIEYLKSAEGSWKINKLTIEKIKNQ